MKNRRIIQAYDSINPGTVDRERMLQNILAEQNTASVRKKESRVYRAKPARTSRTGLFLSIAACLAVLVVSGFVLNRLGRTVEAPEFAEPDAAEHTIPEKTAADHYAPILQKYRLAIEEGWTQETSEIEGITPRSYYGAILRTAGYTLLDLNNDGREELIVAEQIREGIFEVWDLYTTLEDGTPIQLWVNEFGGVSCYIHENDIIGIHDSGAYPGGEYVYYTLENGQLVQQDSLHSENDQWLRTNAEGETATIPAQQAMEVIFSYKHKALNLTSFADMAEAMKKEHTKALYSKILQKYEKAISEGWDGIECSENGLSTLTPVDSEYEGLYYSLYDLNGDGTDELIVSEYSYREDTDTSFIDIFTIADGEVQNVMYLSEVGYRSLCEGGYVKDLFFESEKEYEKYAGFYRLEADMFVLDLRVYQKNGQWFTEGYRGVGAAISREEADSIIASYPPLKLDFTQIKASTEPSEQTQDAAFDAIVNKYITALNENWSQEMCEQNDISPDIFNETTIRSNLGWCLMDLDNNGTDELIISDGVHLFDLYVMLPYDAGPGHLICANGGETYQLCENNVIQMYGLYSGTTAWRYYILRDSDLVQRDMLFYDGQTNQYSYGTDDDSLNPIAKEKAGDILFRDRTLELTLTPFLELVFDPSTSYEPILQLHRTAIAENWDPPACMEQGMSLMIAHYGDYYDALGYTFLDLDGNGKEELLITDGTNIYAMYTSTEEEDVGTVILFTAMERIKYYLTEDGLIYNFGSSSAWANFNTFLRLEDGCLAVQEGYFFDGKTDPDHPWYFYDGETIGSACGDFDAQAAIDSHKIVEIPFTSFE